ncbi:catenin alpha-2-like [Panthera tigris]|uniref:catenin alpha-2-like n=1 Tax=Panthera tigris TaxID=9694 RepID=UPI001C6FB780|nr:catenin alpha-2-like [Panthera tigris]XP_042833026.1 catenin alpha-2-like [Panthera tigris]
MVYKIQWSSELKDPHCRNEMAAARGALKKNATMLYTASQALLRHPHVAATRANRDYVFKQVQEAIAGISNAAQATSPTDEAKGHTGIGELAAVLNEFDTPLGNASAGPMNDPHSAPAVSGGDDWLEKRIGNKAVIARDLKLEDLMEE